MSDMAAVSTLRTVFRAETEGHRALLSVLMAEQEALRTANAEAVALASSAKLRHIQELETLAQSAPVETPAPSVGDTPVGAVAAPKEAHSSAELLEAITGKASDAPLCMTCGIKMRPAGSCYVCEGCGSTSGCS